MHGWRSFAGINEERESSHSCLALLFPSLAVWMAFSSYYIKQVTCLAILTHLSNLHVYGYDNHVVVYKCSNVSKTGLFLIRFSFNWSTGLENILRYMDDLKLSEETWCSVKFCPSDIFLFETCHHIFFCHRMFNLYNDVFPIMLQFHGEINLYFPSMVLKSHIWFERLIAKRRNSFIWASFLQYEKDRKWLRQTKNKCCLFLTSPKPWLIRLHF